MRYVKYVTVLILVFFLAGCCGNLEVTIGSPQDGSAFNVGEAITFSGSANFGAQPIADEMLVWTSDRDGVIGEGETFTRSDLSEGVHQITLTASSDEDNTCTENIQITIIILNPKFGEMTDTRDGQTYQTVQLGDQTWLAQDLNYETENSWCYQDDPANCEIFGRLYDWEAAMDACPDGWHLASDDEWATLVHYLDPRSNPDATMQESYVAGGMMKATGMLEDGTGLWRSPNKGATNASGFSAVPSGTRFNTGLFVNRGQHVFFWTATEYNAECAWTRMLDYGQSGIFRHDEEITKDSAVAVRCIKD